MSCWNFCCGKDNDTSPIITQPRRSNFATQNSIHGEQRHTGVERPTFTLHNNLVIICCNGDITQTKAEGIVFGYGGQVMKSLCRNAGLESDEFQKIIESMYGAQERGGVYCIDTRHANIRLHFTNVIVAIVNQFHADDIEGWKRSLVDLYVKSFSEADNARLNSVAIPVLGSGSAGAPVRIAAEALVWSLTQFSPRYLKEVFVVSFKQDVHAGFVRSCQNWISDRSAARTYLLPGEASPSNYSVPDKSASPDDVRVQITAEVVPQYPRRATAPNVKESNYRQYPSESRYSEKPSESRYSEKPSESRYSEKPRESRGSQSDTDPPHRARSAGVDRSRSQQPPRQFFNKKDYMTSNGLAVTCYTGDVTEAVTEGIVTGEGYGMTNASMVTKSLCSRGGIEYSDLGVKVIEKYGSTDLESGNVYSLDTRTCGIRLNFKVIFLAIVLRMRQAFAAEEWKYHTENLYTRILHEVEKEKLESVAIPLLGSGRAGASVDFAADALVKSLFDFKPRRLKTVHVVSFEDHVHSEIVEKCENQIAQEIQQMERTSQKVGKMQKEDSRSRDSPVFYSPDKNPDLAQAESPGYWSNVKQNESSRDGAGDYSSDRKHSQRDVLSDNNDIGTKKRRITEQESWRRSVPELTSGKPLRVFSLEYYQDANSATMQGSKHDENDFDRMDVSKINPEERSGTQQRWKSEPALPAFKEDFSYYGRDETTKNLPGSRQVNEEKSSTSEKKQEESCAICMDTVTNPKTLDKCGHTFCKDCIENCFNNFKPVCPTCNTVYGVITGNQPQGEMKVKVMDEIHCHGYEDCGVIVIDYFFQDGIQTGEHPNPGKPYHGTRRRGFLPDNGEGQSVLRLLRKAFDQRLTFTVGRSTTTGMDDMVTWNDIHHKTNTHGGPTRFGYPDPTYLKRVKEELASKGITE